MTSKLRVNRLINKSKDFNYKSMISKIPNPNRTCLHQNPTDCFGFFHFPTPPTKKYQKLNLGFFHYRGWFNHQLDEINNLSTDFVDVYKPSCFGFPLRSKKTFDAGNAGRSAESSSRSWSLRCSAMDFEANLAGNVTPKESLLPTFGPFKTWKRKGFFQPEL